MDSGKSHTAATPNSSVETGPWDCPPVFEWCQLLFIARDRQIAHGGHGSQASGIPSAPSF